jgi:magnesium-transporting ATPase (P-type)
MHRCYWHNPEKRSLSGVVVSGLTGILVFLVLLVIFGYLASYYHNEVFIGLVALLVNNLGLVLTASVLFIVADIFYTFRFPFSIPGPLFSGLGSLFVISLLFIIMDFFDQAYSLGISVMFLKFRYLIYPLVFFIVIIAGYARILSPDTPRCSEPEKEDRPDIPSPPIRSWDEVGNEFRQALYDFFHRIREELNRK